MHKFFALDLLLSPLTLAFTLDRNLVLFPNDAKVGITGGHEARPHSLPYQVFLNVHSQSESWVCGASLISPNYLLTAAHCVDGALNVRAVLGAHNIHTAEDTQRIFEKCSFTVHENYVKGGLAYDIAAVRLPASVTFDSNISPVKLPKRSDRNEYSHGEVAILAGWGVTNGGSNIISDTLNLASVKVMTNEDCGRFLQNMKPSLMCTSGEYHTGGCRGDSGGPLVFDNDVQIGIISFTFQFCPPGVPTGYTRVTTYLDWIVNQTDVIL